MPSFDDIFSSTEIRPVIFNGKPIVRLDMFPVQNMQKLQLVFELANSEWKQGASLKFRKHGKLSVNGIEVSHAVLWQHSAPSQVVFSIIGKTTALEVKNIWDTGDGVIESWQNGAAMIVEELPNGRRYRCNDGHPDENFDDIIFRIERV